VSPRALLVFTLSWESDSKYVAVSSDVNKDWTCKDKDQAYNDQDKDKDYRLARTRTRINITSCQILFITGGTTIAALQ